MPTIRPLRGEDAPAWHALRQQALVESPEAFAASPGEESLELARERLANQRAGTEGFVLGAIVQDATNTTGCSPGTRLVGNVGFFTEKSVKLRHRGRVWGMYVVPEARRVGVGGALLDAVIGTLRGLPGLAVVWLQVSVDNAPALELYESRGFRRTGVIADALRIGARRVDEATLELRL